MSKIRIDVHLVEEGYFDSREKAKRAIMARQVLVNDTPVYKAGETFKLDDIRSIRVKGNLCPYVSRGGLKLEKALKYWDIKLEDKIMLDVGSSTGGFTGDLVGNVTGNVSGTALNVTGVVAIANGGTNATNITDARTNLGLGNLDNTSDVNKPVSTAQLAALNLKANLISPVFTGTPSLPTGTIAVTQGASDASTAIATTAFVNNAFTTTNIAAGRFHAPVTNGSAYEKVYGDVLRTMDQHVDSGSNPNEMAEAVFQIIQEINPRIHYKVGAFMQKFSIVLKRILPDRIYESMLMNHYKL